MSDQTHFPAAAIISAITGKLVGPFTDVHGCIERMAGGSVWTHQLPAVMRRIEPLARAAFPELSAVDVSSVNPETAQQGMRENAAMRSTLHYVPVLSVLPDSPFEHLPGGKDVIVVRVDDAKGDE